MEKNSHEYYNLPICGYEAFICMLMVFFIFYFYLPSLDKKIKVFAVNFI